MIDFDRAIQVAGDNVVKMIKGAKDKKLEGAMISADGRLYEVTFSYETESRNGVGMDFGLANNSNMRTLANLMKKRREYKVFLVDAETGVFRGFKNYKED